VVRSLYGVVGLPTIVFVNKDGTVVKDKTIAGFVNSKEFLSIIKSLEWRKIKRHANYFIAPGTE
jgi:thioredoxin-related protein